jgi:hypothetical protein
VFLSRKLLIEQADYVPVLQRQAHAEYLQTGCVKTVQIVSHET